MKSGAGFARRVVGALSRHARFPASNDVYTIVLQRPAILSISTRGRSAGVKLATVRPTNSYGTAT